MPSRPVRKSTIPFFFISLLIPPYSTHVPPESDLFVSETTVHCTSLQYAMNKDALQENLSQSRILPLSHISHKRPATCFSACNRPFLHPALSYKSILEEFRYFSCSGVNVSMDLPRKRSFLLATSRSTLRGTLISFSVRLFAFSTRYFALSA